MTVWFGLELLAAFVGGGVVTAALILLVVKRKIEQLAGPAVLGMILAAAKARTSPRPGDYLKAVEGAVRDRGGLG